MEQRTYLAIDLKSFYASAECTALGLDPLTTNLVVADVSRTEKTICLAVSPSLKAYGLSGRARLFEVVEKMKLVNERRRLLAPGRTLRGSSWDACRLAECPSLGASYLAVKPRMAHYMKVSAAIYGIYLKYAAPEDVHVYSIDEVFIDATRYLRYFGMTAHELARTIVDDIRNETGITATAGIGTNLYLAKVAMDIVAKHMSADADGVRIAELDEAGYRRLLWGHRPLTDFWRVGRGYARRLESHGLMTMGDVARCSLGGAGEFYNADLLYRMFGVNAELLIDHAWGIEPCTIADVNAYEPSSHSLSSAQVLHCACPYGQGRLIVREMADAMALELVDKGLTAGRIGLYVGYDRRNGTDDVECRDVDHYGRRVPKPAMAMTALERRTSSSRVLVSEFARLYDRIADPRLTIRRIGVDVGEVLPVSGRCGETGEDAVSAQASGLHSGGERYEQPDLFDACDEPVGHPDHDRREHDVQKAMLAVKTKFGRNAVLRGMNFEEGATGRMRNEQIGGHAAGEIHGEHRLSRPAGLHSSADSCLGRGTESGNGTGAGSGTGTDPGDGRRPDGGPRMMPVWIDAERMVLMPEAGAVRQSRCRTRRDARPPETSIGLSSTGRYDDILDAGRPSLARHPPMARNKRAAQFMPYAALTGYDRELRAMRERIDERYRKADGYASREFRERASGRSDDEMRDPD